MIYVHMLEHFLLDACSDVCPMLLKAIIIGGFVDR